ncbi:chromosomal replication initiator protein DnaA [Phascolarctobacterium sp.]|uniref:chromosomal replication initiator protein DnaA n=1 Tax=Phascolarctobacterium sp. TaxID=2049039 RepID=UPI002A80307B|nr:chromosomal replication initiator protein DnaA [Phascolarctobacterium sp.]MDY5045264.1 chromosomal replication initiator protein DnaA [Phascolarctobacterium sp.]MEE1195206.1 chromosomal replication initiator protein DnaA [Phascolarctobacterium sp.]MEE1231375.1 chromosomal replication initiator protein DnaA [Phascolarctobacterium sp.]
MSSYDLAEIWVKCTDKFKESANEKIFDVWIKPIIPLEVTDTYYKVAVKNSFFKTMLEENYANLIEGILSNIMGKNISLIIETMEGEASLSEELLEPRPTKTQQQQLFTEKTAEQQIDESNLNPKFVFETFVIGNSNRFAHAAAQAVANNPAHAYNPLFLYGGVGLGKTHLMHAIGNRIKQNNPGMKVLYTTSEKFTNEIINSIQNKNTEAFRQKYRNIDCLIIDDIQFLKGKEQTQVEFFHTFNALKDANKQIIISSDRPPREIETLEDRLRSRFDQGLTADIQPPDLETRMAILRTKALSDNIQMPNDVITLLATNIATNIREIEGAYTKIVAYTSLMDMPITMETAQKVLSDMGNTVKTRTITFEGITKVVAEHYNIKQDELFNKKRTQNIAHPRQVAMYLCRELADLSYPKIGELFGGRDHTTVIHAYEKISKNKNTNLALQKELQEMIEILQQ